MRIDLRWIVLAISILQATRAAALENLDYVAEHLPEVAMDNRLATLPLWSAREFAQTEWRFTASAGFNSVGSRALRLDGEMLSVAIERVLNASWSVRAVAFDDAMRFSGVFGDALLNPTYLTSPPPLALPTTARFDALSGDAIHGGVGIAISRAIERGWLSGARLTAGLLWERQDLKNYRAAFTIIDGASAGASGSVDYSARYSFLTPFVGMQLRVQRHRWTIAPHWRYMVPLPGHGFVGEIAGSGFALSGDSGQSGFGKYVGDQLLTAGCTFIHMPSGISLELGATIAQYFLEPFTHNGVDKNFVVSIGIEF